MAQLSDLSVYINDTTGQNLTFDQLGIGNHYVPDKYYCANINVSWSDATVNLNTLILGVFTYFVSMMAHEWGHILALKYYLRQENITAKFGIVDNKPRIWTGANFQYEQLSPNEKVNVYLAGILAGLIPITFAYMVNPLFLLLLIPYGIGCTTDVKLIRINLYGEEKVNEQNERIKQWFKGLLRPRQSNGSKRNK